MKRLLPILLCGLCSCAYQVSKVYDPKTGNLAAKSRTFTLWDSQSTLKKLHIDTQAVTNQHGSFSPGISIGELQQQSTSTNLNELLGVVVKGAVQGAVQGAK